MRALFSFAPRPERPYSSDGDSQQFKAGTGQLDIRRFLQTLAERLSDVYIIRPLNPRSRVGVTFSDILAARMYGAERRDPQTQGPPFHSVFSEDKWQLLMGLSDYANDHVQSVLVMPNQGLSMVLPHEFFHCADDLKDIASLAGAISNRGDLTFLDEASACRT